MTVPSTARRAGPYYGTGALVSYPFSFKTFDKSHVRVLVRDSIGVESDLVVDSTVLVALNADQDASPGGSVQYAVAGVATALPSGFTLAVLSALAYSQETDLPEGGNYRATSVEDGLDALAVQVQQLAEQGGRTLVLSPLAGAVSAQLPAPAAGKALGWNGAGDALVNLDAGGGGGGAGIPTIAGQAGKLLSNDGTNLLWAADRAAFGVNVLDYIPAAMHASIRAGTATADVSGHLQTAINAAAASWSRKLFFPAGRYPIAGGATLRTYYDATLNPSYPRTRNGHVELVGEGWDSEASGTGTPGNLCGTLLWTDPSTVRTAPVLEVSPASEDALPYFGRDFVMRDMTVDGNRAGHLVVCRGVPGARFYSVQIRQRNLAGSGLELGTGYIGGLYGCRIANSAAGTGTGDAITLRASIEAGLYAIDQETIAGGFGYGLRVTSGTIQQLNVNNSQLTGDIGGIFVLGGGAASVEMLNITGGYGEGACDYWIKGGSEGIRILRISGGFVYGAGFAQAAIQIDKPDAVLIDGIRVQDLAGTFMNVASLPSLSHNAMTVRGAHFYYTGAISTLRTLFTGVLPALETIEWPEGNANCRLCAISSTPIRMRPLYGADSSMVEAGHFRETSVALVSPATGGTTYYHSVLGYASTVVLGTSSGTSSLELNKGSTAKLGENFHLVVINRGSGTVNVIRATFGTTIATVAANSKTWLRWSDLFDDWL